MAAVSRAGTEGAGGTEGMRDAGRAGESGSGRAAGGRGSGARAYRGDGITVSFDARLCRHAAECVHGLPAVFDTARRPWIMPDAAEPGVIAEVVRRCPTGALAYRLADGGAELPERPTAVRRAADGRLLVRGELRVTDASGEVRETPRAMLCGCGRSAEPPYCDRSGECGVHKG
ncbi:(4Fe-4S)-binding protein [Kitasatospora purpeofusca]|uniref:(4Fe-4S)-binding protein n=1 Tax=Kitasatospora purpeofusca TaxID=67352 RepID=UPI002A5B0C6A|nr:(4Fe-4S)-binding protein [Kitasatospora purpeofusca]MDY0810835.1 (4Fe-4S)-binding protein [Kitasatospora purpeofusca]